MISTTVIQMFKQCMDKELQPQRRKSSRYISASLCGSCIIFVYKMIQHDLRIKTGNYFLAFGIHFRSKHRCKEGLISFIQTKSEINEIHFLVLDISFWCKDPAVDSHTFANACFSCPSYSTLLPCH